MLRLIRLTAGLATVDSWSMRKGSAPAAYCEAAEIYTATVST